MPMIEKWGNQSHVPKGVLLTRVGAQTQCVLTKVHGGENPPKVLKGIGNGKNFAKECVPNVPSPRPP